MLPVYIIYVSFKFMEYIHDIYILIFDIRHKNYRPIELGIIN